MEAAAFWTVPFTNFQRKFIHLMTAGRTSLAARVPTIKKQKFQTVLPLKSRNFPEAKKAFKQEQRKKPGGWLSLRLCV